METVLLTKTMVALHVDTMQRLSSQLEDDYWDRSHYLVNLPMKWELSQAVLHEGEVVAFMIASLRNEYYHINRIVVAPGFQGRHLGKELLDGLKQRALQDHRGAVTLKVHHENKQARVFYERYGFTESEPSGTYLPMALKIEIR